jgi:hypothetical protein
MERKNPAGITSNPAIFIELPFRAIKGVCAQPHKMEGGEPDFAPGLRYPFSVRSIGGKAFTKL